MQVQPPYRRTRAGVDGRAGGARDFHHGLLGGNGTDQMASLSPVTWLYARGLFFRPLVGTLVVGMPTTRAFCCFSVPRPCPRPPRPPDLFPAQPQLAEGANGRRMHQSRCMAAYLRALPAVPAGAVVWSGVEE